MDFAIVGEGDVLRYLESEGLFSVVKALEAVFVAVALCHIQSQTETIRRSSLWRSKNSRGPAAVAMHDI